MLITLRRNTGRFAALAALVLFTWAHSPAQAQVTPFKMSLAAAAQSDADISAFYRDTGYAPLWTGQSLKHRARRMALIEALQDASAHGLPAGHYDVDGLIARMAKARSPQARGAVEVEMSRQFLRYARDVQTGVLVPSRIDAGIVREVPYRDRSTLLHGLKQGRSTAYFRALPPQTAEYTALMKHKMMLEHDIARGGWGPRVRTDVLKPGARGEHVIALRNRLIAMGYLRRTASQTYDVEMEMAVQAFQLANGLEPDGVAGPGTMGEINKSMEQRLQSVVVAMERERWLNQERGKRHILVNQTDFTARIIDDGKVTFETRSVIGKNTDDRRSPEFSDVMEHMVINPSWYVPRSIATKEYLPALKQNPYAVSYLEITDSRGRKVSRGAVDFRQYSARTFPFAMRQPPSEKNALGLVKFMFPNKYNIYLHDTPQKHLFGHESRAYSHGCIRLADPFDFAYALLALQEDDPEAFFQRVLKTGKETKVDLVNPVPVHLIYRTAFTTPKGQLEFRRDIYGRDARIWDALSQAGVVLTGVRG